VIMCESCSVSMKNSIFPCLCVMFSCFLSGSRFESEQYVLCLSDSYVHEPGLRICCGSVSAAKDFFSRLRALGFGFLRAVSGSHSVVRFLLRGSCFPSRLAFVPLRARASRAYRLSCIFHAAKSCSCMSYVRFIDSVIGLRVQTQFSPSRVCVQI
jgi:hypothetical protein